MEEGRKKRFITGDFLGQIWFVPCQRGKVDPLQRASEPVMGSSPARAKEAVGSSLTER